MNVHPARRCPRPHESVVEPLLLVTFCRLLPNAPILPEETLANHPSPDYTDEDRRLVFVEKTRHGGFLGYGGQMPLFSAEVLSDVDMADLLAYLGVPKP